MISITRKQGIIGGAALVAVMLVAGAYYGKSGFGTTPTLSAEETDEILKNYAAKDTDADGVPDWQELLYKTDPANPHSVRADITDKEALTQGLVTTTFETPGGTVSGNIAGSVGSGGAKAGTMTEQFALTFFESYVKTGRSATESDAALQTFVQNAVTEIQKTQTRESKYSARDVIASADSLSSYVQRAEKVFASDAQASPHGELLYFSDAVLKNDASALSQVAKSGKTYDALAEAFIKVPVPPEARPAHLELTNALARLGDTIGDMAALRDDPVRSMLGFGNYEKDVRSFAQALASMHAVLVSGQISPSKGTPGYGFMSMTAYGEAIMENQL